MNFFSGLWPGFLSKARSVFGFSTIQGSTQFNNYFKDLEKLNIVFQNPAVLKVFSLQCDLFSLGKVCVKDKNGKQIDNDPVIKFLKRPNPFQSRSQFLWDFMFWTMIGTDYCYIDSAIPENKNKAYHLDPSQIEWPYQLQRDADKMLFSEESIKKRGETLITYRYDDGTTFTFPLKKLVISMDLTNGIGNWYKSPSRIDALHKIICNSDASLDSKNINVRYAGKFLVGSNNTLNTVGLQDSEKDDIIAKMESDKAVFPLKTLVQIKRFVENLGNQKLDEAYLADYFLIGSEYGIPRDVLEAYVSSTYENQEKARMAHVSYTLQPKGNDFMDALEHHFGYDLEEKNIYIEWAHLPFTQVFEKDRADKENKKINSLSSLLKIGVPIEEANEYLGTKFTITEPVDNEETS